MTGWLLDLRYRLRNLTRRPAFTAAVVTTLALGMGMASALYSVVDALLLHPLPYPEPERLVRVYETVRRETVERRAFSYPDFRDLAEGARSFSHLAAFTGGGVNLTGLEEAQRVDTEMVTPGYFQVLGVEPVLGRSLSAAGRGEEAGGREVEVVLSHGLWRRLFGAEPDALGQTLSVEGRPAVVVGVMPPGFQGLGQEVDLWLPLSWLSQDFLAHRGSRGLAVVGRLAAGAGLSQADEETASVFARLAADYPDSNDGYSATVVGLAEDLFGDLRRPLLLLSGAVAFLLLVAAANVANLLLMRATTRRREAAVQTALGMSRSRKLVQHLLEGLALGLAGGCTGLLLALWALDAFRALNPVPLPGFAVATVHGRVVAFTLLTAVAIGIALALVEAFLGEEGRLSQDLVEAGRSGSGRRSQRLRRGLAVAQVALALALAVGAGLMSHSLARMWRVDPGIETADLLLARFDLPLSWAEEERAIRAGEILEAVRGLPGVEAAALASDLPVNRDYSATLAAIEGRERNPQEPYGGLVRIYRHRVSPELFSTLGIELVAGRPFDAGDGAGGQAVAIVSRTFAQRHFPGVSPLGKRLQQGRTGSDAPWTTIVGVVEDVRYRSLLPDPALPEDPDLYLPLAQNPEADLALAVRSSLPPESLAETLRREVARLSPDSPLYAVTTMAERIEEQLGRERFSTFLLGLFAALTVLLAGVGIYSVMAYLVTQRRREIGVRMALGARPRSVLRQVLREGMGLAGGGAALGLLLAFALSRLLTAGLYEVHPLDPLSYLLTTLLLTALALVACLLPARKASRVDPAVVLRGE